MTASNQQFIARIVSKKGTATIWKVPGLDEDYYKVIRGETINRTPSKSYAFKLAGGRSIERNHRAHPLEHRRF